MMIQAPKEPTNRVRTNVAALRVSFRLNIYTVQTKCILIDHTVNPAVATATDSTTGGSVRPTEPHGKKQFDDKAFKKLWRRCSNAIE